MNDLHGLRTLRFCLVAFWDHFLHHVDLGNSVKAVNPEPGPLSWKFCATQESSEGLQERLKSGKHQIFSLPETQVLLETQAMYEGYHLIQFWNVWMKYIGSACADEAVIRKFLTTCAAELKAWVIIPWAKELEYLDEYCYKCGLFSDCLPVMCGSEGLCWRTIFFLKTYSPGRSPNSIVLHVRGWSERPRFLNLFGFFFPLTFSKHTYSININIAKHNM